MSRYTPADSRLPGDRSRSPIRFNDRRPSASLYSSRGPDPGRGGADAPRGPRSQYDSARPPLSSGVGPPPPSRGGYPGREVRELRDAPPLGSDRGRPYKDREFDRRDRLPSPRDRSPPPRNFRDQRDFPPPRELDIPRARRGSRDGPPSAGSTYSSDAPPAFGGSSFRGGFGRGRGRGDSEFRGGRGSRRNLDDRDLIRRDRSPPPSRWPPRDPSRDAREPERRDDRRFDRREDDRRVVWPEREREIERPRREPPPPRLEARNSNDSLASSAAHPVAAPHVNPERLALLESSGADISVRRQSLASNPAAVRDPRREQPELPAYLNGRAETTNNRYGSRGSSPPTQAPPVPAFTLSLAPSAQNGQAPQATRLPQDLKQAPTSADTGMPDAPRPTGFQDRPPQPAEAPLVPKPPQAPKAQAADPPPAAPKAPRALDNENPSGPGSRLHGVRSWEHMAPSSMTGNQNAPPSRAEALGLRQSQSSTVPPSPNMPQYRSGNLTQPASPAMQQPPRPVELTAPTGPKATRASPSQPSVSPRAPFQPPFQNNNRPAPMNFNAPSRIKTPPPPSAPSGPRNRAYSVSPKVSNQAIPTAPKASRPPLAPRGADRPPVPPGRGPGGPGGAERLNTGQPWAPPTAPRASQWNQWRRPGAPMQADKTTIPTKRDFNGEERGRNSVSSANDETVASAQRKPASENEEALKQPQILTPTTTGDKMDIDSGPHHRNSSAAGGHSAQQSFFGKPVEKQEDEAEVSDAADEALSTSEDDDLEVEDPALFEAKYERQKRELEAQLVDMSSREVRATTPLESIARLWRISAKDLERFQERDRQMDLDVDEPQAAPAEMVPPPTHSSESEEGADVMTPKGEDTAAVEIHESEDIAPPARRIRRPSPEVITLPYLLKDRQQPFHESEEFVDSLAQQAETKGAVLNALQHETYAQQNQEEDCEDVFEELYTKWRDECDALDREREEEERAERQQSFEPRPEADVPSLLPPMSAAESRRLHKHSSEYEIEQVLKQSEETARLEAEKADREAKKVLADMEKEAIVPDHMTAAEAQRSRFVDNNRLRDPASLTTVFAYQPPEDDFTEHEQQVFIAAFKEAPKKWSDIASLLPGRVPKDCIRHYYANKWDGRFRDNRRKRGGGKRGGRGKGAPRGKGSAAMADMGRSEELVQNVSDSGRPKRAAAPTTFGEKEQEAKAAIMGNSPAKRPGPNGKQEGGEGVPEKQVKRRKAVGEKPGRKPKATTGQQPLAQLAAAPSSSMGENTRFVPNAPPKEELAAIQSLEDASLLAGLHAGHRNVHPEAHPVYIQEGYPPQAAPVTEEPERTKPAGPTPSSKPSASSYWSVPEQSDFVKYIAHFGTDFAAIAAHMGTKTQTMIKNHYQRQIDGGNRAELSEAADVANARRERGEDMGVPPTPTPITKRKYDNPGPTVQRALAPQADAMDIDEPTPAPGPRPQASSNHASPPQFQMQPRFTSSAQATPVQASRVAPSPVPAPDTTATPLMQAVATTRNLQQPLGSRFNFLGESRPESRPPLSATPSFRGSQGGTPIAHLTQSSRTAQDAHNPEFISNLLEEQRRALRQQGEQSQERHDRIEPFQQPRHTSLQHTPIHKSPMTHPLNAPPERKPAMPEERAPTPPRPYFPASTSVRRSLGSPAFASTSQPQGTIPHINRMPSNPSPPKREETRPSSVLSAPPAPPPTSIQEAPKRSNLLSILNSEPEEPRKAPQRMDSEQAVSSTPQRPASPAHATGPPPPSASSSNLSQARREVFGQPNAPQSQFQPRGFGQSSAGPSPQLIKQETPNTGNAALNQQMQKPDWPGRVLGPATQQPPPPSSTPTPALEREVRPYFSHRSSMLGPLNEQQRGNPSPPPHLMSHSRTPSLTGQALAQAPREQRSFMTGQPPQQQQQQPPVTSAGPTLQSNPYAPRQPQQPPPPFAQTPPQPQVQKHAHHAHNNSLGGGFGGMHQRTVSRDDVFREQQQAFAAHQQQQQQEQDWHRMHMEDRERRIQADQHRAAREEQMIRGDRRTQEKRAVHEERRAFEGRRVQDMMQEEQRRFQDEREREILDSRRREAQFMAQIEQEQRQHQQQQQQQQNFHRGMPPQPPPGMHHSHFPSSGNGPYEQGPPPRGPPPGPPPQGLQQGPPQAQPMGMSSLREQSMREAQDLMQAHAHEQERMRRESVFREQQQREGMMQLEDSRRRHEEALFPGRGTPFAQGGGFGPPGGPGQGQGQGRR